MVSATTFTLVGVVNKFLTVLLNVALWEKHSSPLGIVSVCVCLLAGTFYQQSPRRDETRKLEIRLELSPASTDASTQLDEEGRDGDDRAPLLANSLDKK